MKRSSSYLKMRILGAIEYAPGTSIQSRIKRAHTFTWRTIQTWYSHYQKHGVTSLLNKLWADKAFLRKVSLKSSKRLAFAKAHANGMWQADTLTGFLPVTFTVAQFQGFDLVENVSSLQGCPSPRCLTCCFLLRHRRNIKPDKTSD
ncbi:MAG: hypothetical protein GY811_13415 [Myxococcales bacterium]|nr:hypothetical protein [Myxococcales bacterium]